MHTYIQCILFRFTPYTSQFHPLTLYSLLIMPHWAQFVLLTYSWCEAISWLMTGMLGAVVLKEMDCPSLSSQPSTGLNSQLGVGGVDTSLSMLEGYLA